MKFNAEERLAMLREAGGNLYSEEDLVYIPVFNSMRDALRFQELSEEEQQEAMQGVKISGALGEYDPEDLVRIRIDDETMYPQLLPEDSILVAFRVPVEDGMPAIVRIDGGSGILRVRRIHHRGDGLADLIPMNENYPGETIEAERFQVLGKAAYVDRTLL